MNLASPGSARSLRALEWLNAVVADVRAGVGPYLAIYLRANRHWDPASIGLAMSAMDLASVFGNGPAGALTDRFRGRRLLVAGAAMMVAIGCLVILDSRMVVPVVAAQALIGATGTLFPCAIGAITLGLVGPARLPRQIGRNEMWNHAGNVITAVLAGLIGYYIAFEGVFYLVVALSIAAVVAVFTIRGRDIDEAQARGARDAEGHTHIVSMRALLADRRIVVFGLCAVLFHFANAAMLPLVGLVLSLGGDRGAPLYMSACIITAQLVMVPVAAWAGRASAVYGRKWVFMIGFTVLPIRGVLYTLTRDPVSLVAVQILDGVGAGIFGVVSVLVVADMTQGTGRFNLTNGAISTATGLGAALSQLTSGVIVQRAGFNTAFFALAGVAAIGLSYFWIAMPETGDAGVTTPIGMGMSLERGNRP